MPLAPALLLSRSPSSVVSAWDSGRVARGNSEPGGSVARVLRPGRQVGCWGRVASRLCRSKGPGAVSEGGVETVHPSPTHPQGEGFGARLRLWGPGPPLSPVRFLMFSLLSSPCLAFGTWTPVPKPATECASTSRARALPPPTPAAGAHWFVYCPTTCDVCTGLPKAIVAVGFSVSMTTIRGWLLPKVAMATIRGESCLGCFGWLFHE